MKSKRDIGVRGPVRAARRLRRAGCVALVLVACALAGCRLDMHVQPKYNTYDPSDFFADGRSARQPVTGTVARGELRIDEELYTGKVDGKLVNEFPFPIGANDILRGQERYNIYCSPCHDYTGSGRGMIVMRGFPPPPSYHIDRLRQAPLGHFFDVMTNGFGSMYSYASRITPEDRWRITAYIRALQLSENAKIDDVPPADRPKLEGAAAMTPAGSENLQPVFERLQRGMLMVGAIGLAGTVTFYAHDPDQFFRSYLLAFVFWIGLPLGCMAILMLNYLTGGDWGLPIRRPLEAGTRTFPVMLVIFLPLLFGLKRLYPWMRPEVVAADPILQAKHFYLNPQFFLARLAIYIVVWLGMGYLLSKWSEEEDQTGDPSIARKLEGFSGPGLIIYGITVTYASIDWVMSLEPHWYSTIFGMIFMMTGVLGAMALVIIVASLLANHEPYASLAVPSQFNDLGNLLLTFVMLWAYLSFSQWLIIWSGNLRDEIPWYMTRGRGAWEGWGLFLIVFHFAVPFLLLLQRGIKRRGRALLWVAAMLVFTDFMAVIWMIVPAFSPDRIHIHPMDLTALCGVGGIWVSAFIWQLKRRPLWPLRAARAEGLAQHGD